MTLRNDDARFMALAFSLGRRGLGTTWPNPAVGAVVVRHLGGQPIIVGRGWTQPGGRPHAETEALRRAGKFARGATLYVTLEPCSHHGKTPPCVEAIIAAGIRRVVSTIDDPNPDVAGGGFAKLRAAGTTVDVGVAVDEARCAHSGHIRRVQDGRPHILLKLAVSADGKAGLVGRRPVVLTGAAARAYVHRLRAMSDAILVGIGTALADDPQLTCRLPGMTGRSPIRMVLDEGLRIPLDSALARTAGEAPVWVFAGPGAPAERETNLQAAGVMVKRVPATAGMLDLDAMLKFLGEHGITRLMVEGGPIIAASFLAADRVDEAVLLRAPKPLGEGIDALEGLPLTALTQSDCLRCTRRAPLEDDSVEFFARV